MKKTYKVGFVLKGVMQVSDPSAIAKDKYISLLLKACGFRPFEHFPLVEDFESINAIRLTHLDHADFAKGTPTDNFEDLKVIFAQPQIFHSSGHGFHWKITIKIVRILLGKGGDKIFGKADQK